MPQPPQFAGSLLVSMHWALHRVVVPPHVLEQVPALQTWPGMQVTPHAPQLPGSLSVGTHTPAQSTSPAGHAHTPSVQAVPPVQATPHAPQFRLSLVTSTQDPPHAV
jgi:hypothetical protein